MNQNGAVLSMHQVVKSFREPSGMLQVLRGITPKVRAGEIVMVQGPSGSGKTTLLQIAGCLLRAESGRVEIAGVDVNSASDSQRTQARQRYFGFVFQHFHLIEALSAVENVMIGLRLKRKVVDLKQAGDVLALLGLATKATKLPRDLSGGEKQRVAFARALVSKPSLLLADEPTSQLDSHAAEAVSTLVRNSVREYGCAAVIATHDTRLHAAADRVITIREGFLYD